MILSSIQGPFQQGGRRGCNHPHMLAETKVFCSKAIEINNAFRVCLIGTNSENGRLGRLGFVFN